MRLHSEIPLASFFDDDISGSRFCCLFLVEGEAAISVESTIVPPPSISPAVGGAGAHRPADHTSREQPRRIQLRADRLHPGSQQVVPHPPSGVVRSLSANLILILALSTSQRHGESGHSGPASAHA